MVVATVLFALLLLANLIPALGELHADPSAHLREPVRSLFIVSEATRRSVQGAFPWEPPWWSRCDTCSRAGAERVWARMVETHGPSEGADAGEARPASGATETIAARDAVLAGWGDSGSRRAIEELAAERIRDLPPYLRERVEELRDGSFDHEEPGRTSRLVGSTLAYRVSLLAVMVSGALVARRVLCRGERATFDVVPLWQALAIVVLSLGFAHGAWPIVVGVFGSLPFVWPLLPAVPALILLHAWCFWPQRRHMGEVWGAGGSGRPWSLIVAAGFAGFALDLWFVEGVDLAGWGLGWTWRWTDGVDESTFFGEPHEIAVLFVEAVILAPAVEELLFRGVLFGALRRHAPFVVAALLQALVFAALHVYSFSGLLTVAGAGVVFALLYERTGSLVPSVIAHSLANASALVGTWLMRP